MRSSITGGLAAFVLGGAGLIVASIWAGPPAPRAALDAPAATQVATPEPAPEPAQQPAATPEPQPAPEPEPEPTPEPTPEPEPTRELAPATAPQIAPASPSDLAAITAPVATDGARDDALPRLDATAGASRAAPPALPAMPAAVEPPPVVRRGALVDFAVEFSIPADQALLAIVLRDDPALLDAPALIAALPMPVSVVLDLTSADVTNRMRAYRAAGLEVLATAPLPQGVSPADIAASYDLARSKVPQAVAVFGAGADAADPLAVDHLMGLLAADGRGFVAVQAGLGGVLRQAQDAGVAAVPAAFDLPPDAQDGVLADAAFGARQTGQAVLSGAITPSTLALLRGWDGQGQVTVVPVSGLLLRR